MRISCLLVAALAVGTTTASFAADRVSSTVAYSGVTYSVWTTTGQRPSRIHVVEIDLSSAEVTTVATRSDERGQTVSGFAASRGAQIVINGDFFSPLSFRPAGVARGDGLTWDDTSDDPLSGFLSLAKTINGTEATISLPSDDVAVLDPQVSAAVGGRPMLVLAGVGQSPDCDDTPTLACVSAPRTAIATGADGRVLYLVVVDGWQADSYGLTAAELGVFLASDLGAQRSLQLDSGSASAMFIENQEGLVSSPSDGSERLVANHLAILHGALPPGAIQGGVFDTVVGGDKIIGATVTLDTGEETTYTGDTLWSFVVPPRFVCATGSAAGYQDQTQCRQILSGTPEYASMALLPEGAPRPDAGATGSDGGGADAGDGGGGGSCGCQSGSDGSSGLLAVLAWALLAVRRRRR